MPPTSLPSPSHTVRAYAGVTRFFDRFQALFALAVRVYVARVFLLSGLTKINDWNTTVALFENEYHVPVLAPPVAALLGTSAELVLPALLILGLGSRFSALALFAFNIVAVISYPDLSDAGLKDHGLWGALLLVTFLRGPGKYSIDQFIARRWGNYG